MKNLEQEKNTLKKKVNEQAQENQKAKDKLDKLNLDYQELKDNFNTI